MKYTWIPKKPIYILLYLGVVVGACYLLHWWWNRPDQVVTQVEETYIDRFIRCFDEYKSSVGGVVQLTRGDELRSILGSASESCLGELCAMMSRVDGRGYTSVSFYEDMYDDGCQRRILNWMTQTHHRKVEQLPLQAFFFNSGERYLTRYQEEDLEDFIRYEQKRMPDYGIVLIGRASRVGVDTDNRRLSSFRARNIKQYLEQEYINDIPIDYVYFGADPPQLDKEIASRYDIPIRSYMNVQYGRGRDDDFTLRLNQSVLTILYPIEDDPFGLHITLVDTEG